MPESMRTRETRSLQRDKDGAYDGRAAGQNFSGIAVDTLVEKGIIMGAWGMR